MYLSISNTSPYLTKFLSQFCVSAYYWLPSFGNFNYFLCQSCLERKQHPLLWTVLLEAVCSSLSLYQLLRCIILESCLVIWKLGVWMVEDPESTISTSFHYPCDNNPSRCISPFPILLRIWPSSCPNFVYPLIIDCLPLGTSTIFRDNLALSGSNILCCQLSSLRLFAQVCCCISYRCIILESCLVICKFCLNSNNSGDNHT